MARDKKKRVGGMVSAASLMEGAFPTHAAPEEVQLVRIVTWWSKNVPARVVKNARPVRLVRGKLAIHVTSSAWASELSFQQSQFLAALQKTFPEMQITEVRARVGPLPELAQARADDRDDHVKISPPLRTLPDELMRALAAVADDDLRTELEQTAKVLLAPRPQKSPRLR